MNNPKISVVTVCYNAVDTIEKTMLSVINQTYPNIEYIIIDGASTDGTVDIIQKYRDKIAYFVSEPDKGIYDAMNKSLNIVTGEWVCFMNAGDVFHDNTVISNMGFDKITNDKSIGCVYGDYISKNKLRIIKVSCTQPFYKKNNLIINPSMGFHHQSLFVRVPLAKDLNFDNITYKLCADYNMIYRLYQKSFKFIYVPVVVSIVDNSQGTSASNRVLQLKEHYKILGYNNIYTKYRIMKLRTIEALKRGLRYNRWVALFQLR